MDREITGPGRDGLKTTTNIGKIHDVCRPSYKGSSSSSRTTSSNQTVILPLHTRESPQIRRVKRDTIHAWIWELASIGISFGIVGAMFTTLAIDGGQDVPQWPLSLNLNSLISIYSTVLRGLLFFTLSEIISQEKWAWLDRSQRLQHLNTFDSASRGAWGSFKLIIVSYKSFIPSAAAVTMVILLAVGPFSQQSVQTTTCSRKSDSEALIPIANKIPTDDIIYNGTDHTPFGLQAQSFQALLSGLTSSEEATQTARLKFTCATGNCTFPEFQNITYSSVGICSKCEDLTRLIEELQDPVQLPLSWNVSGSSRSNRFPIREYEYRLKDPFGATVQIRPVSGNMIHVNSSVEAPYNLFTTTILVRSLRDCALRSTRCPARPGKSIISTPNTPIDVTGARCSLYPCLKQYHGEIINGRLVETIVKTSPLDPLPYSSRFHPNFTTFIGVAVPCSLQEPDGTLVQLSNPTEGLNITDGTLGEASWWYVLPVKNQTMLPASCAVEVDTTWMRMLGNAVKQVLSGSCGPNEQRNYTSYPSLHPMACLEPWWLQSLWENDRASFATISSRFENISLSLTNRMREIGLRAIAPESSVLIEDRAYAKGSAHTSTLCTRFDWQWMLLPAGVTLLTSILLIASIFRTYQDIKNGRPAWKSSILPLLFHGFKNHTDETLLSSWMSLERMGRRADMVTARYTTDAEDGREGYGLTVTTKSSKDVIYC
ncbi:hypothetical protein QBC43DRAFT_291819 [Cladorrhinum sp. PSN259]|nr:hypothetical protein QBC43DRAFT_291819 [Cladorrhinum sp. PSN259]